MFGRRRSPPPPPPKSFLRSGLSNNANPTNQANAQKAMDQANAQKAMDQANAQKAMDQATAGRDMSLIYPRGFKKGGKVGSASKRADGIAQRGKTKGRYI